MSCPFSQVQADERLHHVIGEAGVLDDVLAAQEHELRGLGRDFLQRAQAVERVFVQEAQAGIDGGRRPRFRARQSPSRREWGRVRAFWDVAMRVAAMD